MLAVLIAAFAAAVPAPAAAQAPAGPAGWGPTQQLSTGAVQNGSAVVPFPDAPTAGVDATGRALALWTAPRFHGDRTTEVRLAVAPAGEPFGAPRVVARGTFPRNPGRSMVAVAPDGRALMAWMRGDDSGVVAAGSVDGRFASPVVVGDTTLITHVVVLRGGAGVVLARGGDDRTVAYPVTAAGKVARAQPLGMTVDDEKQDTVAVGADGTIAVVDGRRVRIRRPGAARFGRLQEVLPLGVIDSAVGVGDRGQVAVAGIVARVFGERARYGDVVLAERRRRGARFRGPVRAPAGRSAFGLAVTYGSTERPVVAWVRDTDLSDVEGEAERPYGTAEAWSPGRARTVLRRGAWEVQLGGIPAGVLALSGGDHRSAHLLAGRATRLAPPAGRQSGGREWLATGPARSVLVWEGAPDGGIRAAFTTPR